MRIEGKVFKDGKFWLVEIPALDYLTQGRTRQEAFEMAIDIVREDVGKPGFEVSIAYINGDNFTITTNDPRTLIAHMLKRLRQKSGLSIREVSAKLNSKSPNAYGVYEQGKSAPTLEQLDRLLNAIDPEHPLVLSLS